MRHVDQVGERLRRGELLDRAPHEEPVRRVDSGEAGQQWLPVTSAPDHRVRHSRTPPYRLQRKLEQWAGACDLDGACHVPIDRQRLTGHLVDAATSEPAAPRAEDGSHRKDGDRRADAVPEVALRGGQRRPGEQRHAEAQDDDEAPGIPEESERRRFDQREWQGEGSATEVQLGPDHEERPDGSDDQPAHRRTPCTGAPRSKREEPGAPEAQGHRAARPAEPEEEVEPEVPREVGDRAAPLTCEIRTGGCDEEQDAGRGGAACKQCETPLPGATVSKLGGTPRAGGDRQHEGQVVGAE